MTVFGFPAAEPPISPRNPSSPAHPLTKRSCVSIVVHLMSLDLNDLLKDWPHEPGRLNVRKIRGRDGKEKLQLRIDLGVIQMEMEGRPDGQQPHGHGSLLAYHQA